MKNFYKVIDGKTQIGSGMKIPKGFNEYEIGKEPKDLIDALVTLALEQAKAEKLLQIEADFNLAESQSVSYLGFDFVGGIESVTSIDGYVRLNRIAGITIHNIWDVNGVEHNLSDAEADGLLLAIGSQASANKFTKKNRKVALANATTIAEVEAV